MEVETLFRVFCLYTLIERPKITSGETFSLDSDSPIYLLRQESCTIFEDDDLFYNPYGMWNLVSHQGPEQTSALTCMMQQVLLTLLTYDMKMMKMY
ncbi:hypothetical protein M3600_26065 [Niallia sp. MER 6]|nr:hypothetical protein [Niallia sp. MER 6]